MPSGPKRIEENGEKSLNESLKGRLMQELCRRTSYKAARNKKKEEKQKPKKKKKRKKKKKKKKKRKKRKRKEK